MLVSQLFDDCRAHEVVSPEQRRIEQLCLTSLSAVLEATLRGNTEPLLGSLHDRLGEVLFGEADSRQPSSETLDSKRIRDIWPA